LDGAARVYRIVPRFAYAGTSIYAYRVAARRVSRETGVGKAWKKLTAGTYALDAQSGKPTHCARRIVVLVAGDITLLKDSSETDDPPGAVFQGFVHDGDTADITITGATVVMVYW